MSVVSFVKSHFVRPAELSAGSIFALGNTIDRECLWRVCRIQAYVGIPHAKIEQIATGVTKTVAVSALLGDRKFKVMPSGSA